MRIYLLRHAERKHGEEQDKLTEKGIRQSNEIIRHLKKLNLDKIICADTNRAKKTIEPFLKEFFGEIIYTNLVNEQEMGELTGKTGSEYREQLEKSGLSKEKFRPKGGENYFDLINRAKKFLEIIKKDGSKNILVSTHAGFIRSIVINLLDLPKENLIFDSASLTIFELDDNFKIINYELNKTLNED
jgi:probable phosphoglycerate mutase